MKKILLYSVGSRGDIEPFMAIGHILKKNGWNVICCFPEQFREMVEEDGFPFLGFDKRFLELIEGEKGKKIMGGGGNIFQKIGTVVSMARESMALNKNMMQQQHDYAMQHQPDKIIFHPKCLYPIIWSMKYEGRAMTLCPLPCIIHEQEDYTAIGIHGNSDRGAFLNKMSYRILGFIRSMAVKKLTKSFQKEILGKTTRRSLIYTEMLHKIECLYTFSPTLYDRPRIWKKHLHVVGYHERIKTNHWTAENELISFIDKYEKIVFITFGSMSNPKPKEKTQAILDVLIKHNIPAIINTSWGGLEKPNDFPGHIYFVNNIPYEWIFPKMYAVVHHGGSGTTHTAIKHGCASLIIPHIVDQYFWNQLLYKKGVGPLGVPIKRLKSNNFEPILLDLLDLLNNENYKSKAQELSKEMKNEFFEDKILDLINK